MMKKIESIILILILFTGILVSCGKDEEAPPPEESNLPESYTTVINLQEEIGDKLDEWFVSLDSIEAVDMAIEYFENNAEVTQVTAGDQGIAVQYANGMRGGILLDPKRGEDLIIGHKETPAYANQGDYKTLISPNKMLFIDPTYLEFPGCHYNEMNFNIPKLSRANISSWTLNEGLLMENYTALSGYGILNISSHGYAWPKEENVTEVYLLTGETINPITTKKYWDEIKEGNIPIILTKNVSKYWISPDFIINHNDFSQDTTFILATFCYSFLGSWPDLVDAYADATYMGYNWAVKGSFGNYCSLNMVSHLSDTSRTEPMNMETWMNLPDVNHSYYNADDDITVTVNYAGNGNIKFWEKVEVDIEPLSDNGAPIDMAGNVNINYPFKCEVTGISGELEYTWDIGDGSAPFTTTKNEVEANWTQNGIYELVVVVKDIESGNEIGNAKATVQIGTASLTWNAVKFRLQNLPVTYKHEVLPGGTITYNDFVMKWTKDLFWHSGVYQTGNFTAHWNIDHAYANGWNSSGSILLNIDEQTQQITGGSIHAELRNINTPNDNYHVIDLDINEMNSEYWTIDHGSFLLRTSDVCNVNYLTNINYVDQQKLGETTYINTLDSYSCDNDYLYLSIDFSTE